MPDDQADLPQESSPLDCHELGPAGLTSTQRDLIAEEPLLMVVAGKDLATVMCTPGDEIGLTTGYLLTEGIISGPDDIAEVDYRRDDAWGNIVRVTPAEGVDVASRLTAYRKVYSSCGICGYEAIREVASGLARFDRPHGRLRHQALIDLAELVRRHQRLFKRTGATHAAGLVEVHETRIDTATLIVKEDIGRHNALDKAIGQALRDGRRLDRCLAFLSGRISFEMASKAARAGVSDIAAVSAPTGLAVDLARQLGMFLAGFARGDAATVYSGPEALVEGV